MPYLTYFIQCLVCVSLPVGAEGDPGAGAEPLKVYARARPESCYVGQALDLWVSVVAGRERPVVSLPAVAGAEVTFVKDDPLRPISVSGIGDAVFEKNLFRSHFRLIPGRAGLLTVPPVAARLGARVGVSATLSVNVKRPPEAGRTADFLGGVGPFELDAAVESQAVRPGQPIPYRITVSGPAARGMTAAPSLARLGRSPLGFRVEPKPDQFVADPPSRTFVFWLRPTRVGSATLPPVTVAALDPKTGRYVTKVTPGIPVRVAAAPTFDPDSVAYGPGADETVARPRRGYGYVICLLSGLAAVTAVSLGIGGAWRRPASRARRHCRRVGSRLARPASDAEAGRTITDGLIRYLALTTGRPQGTLTPVEAEEAVIGTNGSVALGSRARTLIAACDRALFAGGPVRRDALNFEGVRFFRDLAATPLTPQPEPGGHG